MMTVGNHKPNMRSLTGGWAQGQGPESLLRVKVKNEVHLEATASELHSLSLQQKLADLSAQGTPVQVSVVKQRSAPAPVVAAPARAGAAPSPVPALPIPFRGTDVSVTGQVAGMSLSMAGALLGSAGAVLLNQAIQMGPGPLAELMGQQGLSGLLPMIAHLDIPTAVAAAITGGCAAAGGWLMVSKVGDLLKAGRSKPAPSQTAKAPRASVEKVLAKTLGGWLGMVSMAGSATGGFLGGHLLASAAQMSSPVVMGTAVAGATLVGMMGLLGGWSLGKNIT